VLASFRGERSIAEICHERDISEALLRRWRDQMGEAGMERYAAGQDRSLRHPSSAGGYGARAGAGQEDL